MPDPLASQLMRQTPYEPRDTETYNYDDYEPTSEFPTVGVNDLPNTEEPDIFVMDFKSLERPKTVVVVCDYDSNDELYCNDL